VQIWSSVTWGDELPNSRIPSIFDHMVRNSSTINSNYHQGQIVLMDNLAAHKGKKVLELIEARGCQLLFLPGYSPDFSPIEESFSKLKAYLRRTGARTREARKVALCQALLTVSAQDAQGWFRHCGFLPAEGRGW
jgi:hypothetical protein